MPLQKVSPLFRAPAPLPCPNNRCSFPSATPSFTHLHTALQLPCRPTRLRWPQAKAPCSNVLTLPACLSLSQATDLATLKSKLGGGYGDVEGFLRFFSLYPNNVRRPSKGLC